ncbi:MAG: M20/M25/M40 family metallo-hydrolase [Elusimicrobia bacterium]|nr:M20/M25/M40 family metallo-hydrolase [Elusimicrobiota bacterium]
MSPLLALALAAAGVAAAAPADPEAAYFAESRERLKALVRLDTSNPPGNEIIAADYLKTELAKDGIASEIFTSSPTRSSLVARLKGSGAMRPIVLMCHTDVVPAAAKDWSQPPFAASEKDGYIYGRGTADIKSMCAVEASLLVWLKRTKTALARDVIFFAEADEETGNRQRHIDWLMKEHAEAVAAEFGVNEGGNTLWSDDGPYEIRIQAAEKEYMDLTLVAHGQAGHASVPRSDNAVTALARAVTRLSMHHFPAQVNAVARGFLETQAKSAKGELKSAIEMALSAKPGPILDMAADRLAGINPEFAAMLRNTVTPTILAAGYKANVIPGEAQATCNARLMPGVRAEDLIAEVKEAIADPSIEVRYDPPTREPVGTMPADTEFYRAVQSAASELAPKARVMPFMAAWTTDSQDLRGRGTIMYGIDPPVTEEDGNRIHGVDERLSAAALDWYARFLREIVLKVAAGPAAASQKAR